MSLAGYPENRRRPWASKAVTWKGQLTQSKAGLSWLRSGAGEKGVSHNEAPGGEKNSPLVEPPDAKFLHPISLSTDTIIQIRPNQSELEKAQV